MKKREMVVLLFLIILMLACGTSPRTPIYESDVFSVSLPEDWLWGGDYWGAGKHLFSVRNPEGILPAAVFSVAVMGKDDAHDVQSLIEQSYQEFVGELTIEDGDFTSDKHACDEYIMDFGRGSATWKVREIWLEKDDAAYILCFRASQTNFNTYEETFAHIRESFEFEGE